MPSASATVTVRAASSTVYAYLERRYDSDAHCSASLATKGYVPDISCLEAIVDRRLMFVVAGRDALTRTNVGGWRWSYDIEPIGPAASRVTITYRWSWWMSLLGAGTTHHQACNEITETAMALDALGWACSNPGDAVAEAAVARPQSVDIQSGMPTVRGIRRAT
jgi:hypothetical protein